MKKVILLVGVLSVIAACEVYTLSYINKIKGSAPCTSSTKIPTPSVAPVVKIDKTNDQTIKKSVQNLFIEDIQAYIQSSTSAKQKLLTVLSYSGTIKDITRVGSDRVTISIKDENNKTIQTYTRWQTSKFEVYKKTNLNLLRSDIEHLTKNDKVMIREFDEVIKDSMSTEETKNSIHYVEITQI